MGELDEGVEDLPPLESLDEGVEDLPSLEDEAAERDTGLANVFNLSLRHEPDKRAGVLRLARDLKVPSTVAEAGYERLQKSWEASQFDPAAWRQANPELAKLVLERPELGTVVMRDAQVSKLRQLLDVLPEANPLLDLYKVGKRLFSDDAETPAPTAPGKQAFVQDAKSLAVTEGKVSRVVVPVARYLESKQQMDISKRHFELMAARADGRDTYELEKQLHDLELSAVQRDYQEGPVGQVLTDVAQAVASQVAVLEDAGAAAGVGAAVGAVAGAAVTKTPAGAAQGALRGASIFGQAGVAGASLRLEAGDMYRQLKAARTDDGQELSEEEARGGALLYGALAAGVEVVSFKAMLRSAGPLGAAFEQGTGRAFMAELMRDGGFREIAKRAGQGWFKAAATEGGEEFTQNLLKDALDYASRSKAAGEAQATSAGNIRASIDDALLAAEKGFIGGGGMGAATTALSVTTLALARSRAEDAGRQVAALAGLKDSPSVKAAPEAVAQMIAERTAAQGEPVTHVYVDAPAFQRLFQSENSDPAEAATQLLGPDGPRVLQEALATGARLEVPVAQYLEKWGTTDAASRLVEDTTTSPALLTTRELAAQSEALEAKAKELADATEPAPAAEQAFLDRLEQQLAATGRYSKSEVRTQVGLWRAFAHTQAERTGVPIEQMLELDVQQGDEQVEVPAGAVAQGPRYAPATQALLERLPDLTAEARAEERFVDRVSGLRTRDAFEPQKGKLVAIITSPDIKALNDEPTGGHDTANQLLRVIGAAVAQVDPNAARSGTNFLLSVDDEAGLQGALERVRAALPDKSLGVEGAAGFDVEKTFARLDKDVKAKRDVGALPERGKTKFNLGRIAAVLPDATSPDLGQSYRLPTTTVPAQLAAEVGGQLGGDYFAETYLDRDVPGLLSARGWNAIPRKAFVAALDLKGLKDINEAFGKDVGDQILQLFGESAVGLGASDFDLAHLSGDEYAAQFDNEAELRAFLDDLRTELRTRSIAVKIGDRTYFPKAEFRDGIGQKTYGAADRALNAAKRRERDQLRGVGRSAASQPQSQGGSALSESQRRARLAARRAGVAGRGARPQGTGDRREAGRDGEAVGGDVGQQLAEPLHTPEEVAAARAEIGRMKSAEKRALASSWLDYCLGLTQERPKVSNAMELHFARAGFVDPVNGFQFDENSRDLAKTRTGRKKKNAVPEELFRSRHFNTQGPEIFQQGTKRYKQDGAGTPRGYTEMARRGLQRVFRVALNKGADLSTFLHESGHVFLEVLGDLAERPDAPADIKADWATALKFMGVDSKAAIKTEHHEKFARGFERYLFEGKAPTPALAGAFERFKLWMRAIYRGISSLGVELNDDIRGVFDRLLATEAELERGKQAMGLRPMFRSPAEAGMSPEAWQAYLSSIERATSHAQQAADLRAMKDRLRETERWWKDEERAEKTKAEEEYEQLPARRAQQALRGKGDLVALPIVLERGAVEDTVGPRAAKAFGTAADGVHPDEVADLGGFVTGAEMLKAIVRLPEKDGWVRDAVRQRMQDKHGDVLVDRDKLREAVGKGLHGEFTEAWLLKEWAALRSKTGGTAGPPVESIKRAAAILAERRQVGRIDAGAVLRAERSAADRAAKAAAKGDYGQAFAFKQQQLLNMYLYRELAEAREEREAFLELAAKLSADKARARLGKASPVYRDAVDGLLEALSLKEPEQREQPLASLGEAVTQMQADGATVMFDAEAVGRLIAQPREWQTLTVAEMREVDRALRNLKGAARARATALVDGKRVDKEQVVADLVADAQKNLPALPPIASSDSAATAWQSFRGWVAGVDGSLLKPELMADWLGGGSLESPWFRALVKPLQDAKAREVDLLKSTIKPVLDAFEAMPAAVRRTFQDSVDGAALFPQHREDLPAPTRRFELLMMALNMGTESNMSRLLEGRRITEAQMASALELLTKEELDWVQSVWDAAESLWPESAALEERDSGLRPGKLERKPLVTRHGTYAGGYFPAVYDRRVEAAGERQQASALAALLDPTFTRPGTSHGHLKSRVEGFSGALSLEPNVIGRHLGQVAHDIAFREALKSVGGLVLDPAIQATLKQRLGDERAGQLLQWLKDVGSMRGGADSAHAGAIMQLVRKLRANTVTAVLGYSIPTALGDLSNILAAVPGSELKAKHWGAGLLEFAGAPMRAIAETEAKSGELRARRDQVQRELTQQLEQLTARGPLSRGPLKWVKDHAFAFFEFTDRATTTPIWLGSYRQALADGRAEADAVTFADRIIRQLFPSHSPVDTAAVLRDKGWVGATQMFYGFFNSAYNRNRDIAHELHTAEDGAQLAKRLPRVAGRLLAYGVAVSVVAELLSGRGREDGEDWEQWFLRKLLAGGLSTVPFGGDLAQAIEGKVLKKRTNPRGNSLVTVATALGEALWNLPDDDKKADKRVKALLRALGPVLGLPVSQPLRTVPYAVDVVEGEAEPRNPADVAGGLIYGQRPGQPANPARLIGDALAGE